MPMNEAPPLATAQRRRMAPEDGGDLWGYPPRKDVYCRACGRLAEPYGDREARTCWLCQAKAESAGVPR